MPMAKLGNINMYYELHGKGKPLILIAGYACDHQIWLPLVTELSSNYQVLLFDNRAVGQTADDGKLFSIEVMAEDIFHLITKLGLKQPTVVGHSMGGMIALTLARDYSDKIGKVFLLNSAAQISARTALLLIALLELRKTNVALQLQVKLGLPWFYSSAFFADVNNILAYVKMLEENPYPQSIQDQERQLQAIHRFDASAWLEAIKSEVVVIAKREDLITTIEESKRLIQGLTCAKLIVMEGAHAIERVDEVLKVITENE